MNWTCCQCGRNCHCTTCDCGHSLCLSCVYSRRPKPKASRTRRSRWASILRR
ncbi:hypothetical protein L873DRAFT_786449 [Choiromyces venosus 120613-1]|uniref:Uncharacterized protein n=1 Tax=Choiromyces venosus 120613-1 TaxID=1336337 RepID=A0A3N4K7W2_9PEZI|nr:hypothetical protein L873DRAFT_786449 [Choiromyces venosus 120613-1]